MGSRGNRRIVSKPTSSKMFNFKADGNTIHRKPQQLRTRNDDITFTGDETITP